MHRGSSATSTCRSQGLASSRLPCLGPHRVLPRLTPVLLCVQEEEEYLIDLMREEEAAEKRRQDAAMAAAKREAAKQVGLAVSM